MQSIDIEQVSNIKNFLAACPAKLFIGGCFSLGIRWRDALE